MKRALRPGPRSDHLKTVRLPLHQLPDDAPAPLVNVLTTHPHFPVDIENMESLRRPRHKVAPTLSVRKFLRVFATSIVAAVESANGGAVRRAPRRGAGGGDKPALGHFRPGCSAFEVTGVGDMEACLR